MALVNNFEIWTNPSRNIQVIATTSNRTSTAVNVKLVVTYTMNNSIGYSGYAQYFTPTIGGTAQSRVTLKDASTTNWYGNPIIIEQSYTVNAAASLTSLAVSIKFTSDDPDDADVTKSGTVTFAAGEITPSAPIITYPTSPVTLSPLDTIRITWQKPNGTVKGYKVSYVYNGVAMSENVNTTSYTFTKKLNFRDSISFTVSAYNNTSTGAGANTPTITIGGGVSPKINGNYKNGDVYVNVGGVWKSATLYVKVNDLWKLSI